MTAQHKWSSSPFLYHPLGHVVTGDLSRHLIRKVPNFREINWDLRLNLCMEAVHNYSDTCVSRDGVVPCMLNEWVGIL